MVTLTLTLGEVQQLQECVRAKLQTLPASAHVGFMRIKEKLDGARPVETPEERWADERAWLRQAGLFFDPLL